MSHIKYYPLWCLYLALGLSAFGQTPPVDLADLSLGDLLNAKIIRSQSNQTAQETKIDGTEASPQGHFESNHFHFSLSYINVKFDGYKDGTKDLSISDVLRLPTDVPTDDNFPVVPTIIHQQAMQFTGAYELSDEFSLSLSIPYIRQETEHVSSVVGFDEFTIISEGIGDIEAGVSWLKWLNQNNSLLFSLGLSLPTGSIDEKGRTPRNATMDTQLPYTMQLGSGTYDLKPSIVFTGKTGDWNYGANLSLTLRTGENSRDYRLGNVYQGSIWTRYELADWIQPSIRLTGISWDCISGQDDEILGPNPAFPYPAAVTNPKYFGGEKLLAQIGLRLRDPSGRLENSFLEVEAGMPFYERLNGPQPSESWRFSASIVLNF
ncbi:MAG: transporter [Opitutaceae bacterium]